MARALVGMRLVRRLGRREGGGQAVLIRSVEALRGFKGAPRGPGLVCRALGITARLDGCGLQGPELWLEGGAGKFAKTARGPRIGLARAGAAAKKPWRFFEAA